MINLSYPELAFVPADMLLLSGDAIVNESMLTGESVPISKMPIQDLDLVRWRDSGEVSAQTAKGFLYAGTRVVRVRGSGSSGATTPAVAMVVRTGLSLLPLMHHLLTMAESGFNTTKGALIRSMLFPKPMGFKFYRDSIHFIGVLACIAGLGFLASAFQFIRLQVRRKSSGDERKPIFVIDPMEYYISPGP